MIIAFEFAEFQSLTVRDSGDGLESLWLYSFYLMVCVMTDFYLLTSLLPQHPKTPYNYNIRYLSSERHFSKNFIFITSNPWNLLLKPRKDILVIL
jgi:hypothetical protein